VCGLITIATRGKIDPGEPRKFLNYLRHRGPDGFETYVEPDGRVAFGHARLAIIDVVNGKQPMIDQQTGAILCFNGEIYNYRELKGELASLGHVFNTTSDTEVLLHSILEWGDNALNKIDGMFAFTFYDPRSGRLFFARDQVGIKPLYYSVENDRTLFASELRAIALIRKSRPALRDRSLIEYLAQGYVCAPNTMLEDIAQLPPGHCGEWRDGTLKTWRYHDWRKSLFQKDIRKLDFAEAVSRTRELVDASVKRQMISDVPLGVLLSGGIDSSLVACSAKSAAAAELSSFTMDFAEKDYSEAEVARTTASLLGFRAHIFKTSSSNLVERTSEIAWATDAPIFDNSFFPSFELAENVAKHVKVALSGDGGDEIFLGYETYRADRIHGMLTLIPANLRESFGHGFSRLVPTQFGNVSWSYKAKAFLGAFSRSPAAAHVGWREIASAELIGRLLKGKSLLEIEQNSPGARAIELFEGLEGCEPLSAMSYIDLETWLPNDILVKTDRASMAHGLELRVPLLGKDLIHFALGLSDEVKFSMRNPKRVLKAVLAEKFPTYDTGAKKRGFVSPMSEWFLGPLSEKLEKLPRTESGILEKFAANTLQQLVDEHRSMKQDHGHLLWAIMALDNWWAQMLLERAK
jgi:asparagine synthase (glutamine-hydrolysing)